MRGGQLLFFFSLGSQVRPRLENPSGRGQAAGETLRDSGGTVMVEDVPDKWFERFRRDRYARSRSRMPVIPYPISVRVRADRGCASMRG